MHIKYKGICCIAVVYVFTCNSAALHVVTHNNITAGSLGGKYRNPTGRSVLRFLILFSECKMFKFSEEGRSVVKVRSWFYSGH